MTQFKVGDRVRLTGENWNAPGGEYPAVGDMTVVKFLMGDGAAVIDEGWCIYEGGYEAELVEEQPNRTHYENTATEHLQAYWGKNNYNTETGWTGDEPPLAPWERELIGTPFENSVHRILNGVAETVVKKNVSYGDSALNPIRVFSKADRMEQLFVRLDDKLSRVQRGSEYPGDDTLRDIIGYCTLILIARESE